LGAGYGEARARVATEHRLVSEGVDQCWSQKERFIKREDLEQAKLDYQHARQTCQRLMSESEVE